MVSPDEYCVMRVTPFCMVNSQLAVSFIALSLITLIQFNFKWTIYLFNLLFPSPSTFARELTFDRKFVSMSLTCIYMVWYGMFEVNSYFISGLTGNNSGSPWSFSLSLSFFFFHSLALHVIVTHRFETQWHCTQACIHHQVIGACDAVKHGRQARAGQLSSQQITIAYVPTARRSAWHLCEQLTYLYPGPLDISPSTVHQIVPKLSIDRTVLPRAGKMISSSMMRGKL